MRIFLLCMLILSIATAHAEPLSSAEKRMKRRHFNVNNKRYPYEGPGYRFPAPRQFSFDLGRAEVGANFLPINPFQISIPADFWPIAIAGVVIGGLVSIAIANDIHRRNADRRYREVPNLPAKVEMKILNSPEITREQLAAEYAAIQSKKKIKNYLEEQ